MIIDIATAISKLRPGAEYTLSDNDFATLNWLDQKQSAPTLAEVEAELLRLTTEVAATAYQRQRAPEYPPLSDLADALYWASEGDDSKLTTYYAACAAVKAKYPKPEVTP